jgi:CO/xanthine dehydrogenase FAD-binding subunit
MKPAPFAYAPAGSVDEALALMTGEDARPLAGGQSLVPMLNFRLSRPALLVDLNPVNELARLEVAPDGTLRIGAMTRQASLLCSLVAGERWPLLAQAVRHVGHVATRSRGTVGGSAAHADPKAELPVALVALDARLHVCSRERGARTIGAADFFTGPYTTAVREDELLVEIEVPAPPEGARMAFIEQARTHGDFAIAGVAMVLAPGRHAAIALLGAGAVPVRAGAAEQALRDGAGAPEVARLAASEVHDDYRRALITALTERALDRLIAS